MDAIAEILDIPFKPWEHITYKEKKFGRRWGRGRSVIEYDAIFETLKSYDKTDWQLGDVVQFGTGYHWRADATWQSWFLEENERENFMRERNLINRQIPVYARNQYAILLARYRWIKYKGYATYRDYGSIVMMLTGSKPGHIRKYFVNNPFRTVGCYPYTNYDLEHETLFHGVEIEDDVTVFLENLVRKLNNAH